MSARPYAGRHRPVTRRRATVRTIGLGLVLPAGAAAALVLTDGSAATATDGTGVSVALVGQTFTSTGTQLVDGVPQPSSGRADGVIAEQVARSDNRAKAALLATENQARANQTQTRENSVERVVSLLTSNAGIPGSHAWIMPVTGYVLTSGYGMRDGVLHPAQDFAVPIGTPVRAMSSGTVIYAGPESGYGNLLVLQYWDGTVSKYGHLNSFLVHAGQSVNAGQVVAYSGNTGYSTGPHVHIEIYPHGGGLDPSAPWGQGSVDPMVWLRAKGLNP